MLLSLAVAILYLVKEFRINYEEGFEWLMMRNSIGGAS